MTTDHNVPRRGKAGEIILSGSHKSLWQAPRREQSEESTLTENNYLHVRKVSLENNNWLWLPSFIPFPLKWKILIYIVMKMVSSLLDMSNQTLTFEPARKCNHTAHTSFDCHQFLKGEPSRSPNHFSRSSTQIDIHVYINRHSLLCRTVTKNNLGLWLMVL